MSPARLIILECLRIILKPRYNNLWRSRLWCLLGVFQPPQWARWAAWTRFNISPWQSTPGSSTLAARWVETWCTRRPSKLWAIRWCRHQASRSNKALKIRALTTLKRRRECPRLRRRKHRCAQYKTIHIFHHIRVLTRPRTSNEV